MQRTYKEEDNWSKQSTLPESEKVIRFKASTETYLLELTPYNGLCIGVCLLNGQ